MNQFDDRESITKKLGPIVEQLNFNELKILNELVVERINLFLKAKSLTEMAAFRKGERVSFMDPKGTKLVGIVTKLNQKTITVQTEKSIWNVPPQFLTKES